MADSKNVLVIDDEPDAITIVESILSEIDGVQMTSAEDGQSGLTKAAELSPDLIILDVQMPGMNGFDVFSALRKDAATKDTPVIMLTGIEAKTGIAFSSDEMKDFLGAEPMAYVEKPMDPEAFQKTVRDALNA